MAEPTHVFPIVPGAALSTDSDPNTAAPSELRTFMGRRPQLGETADSIYVVPDGGTTITIQMWGYNPSTKRWFKIGSATACPTDTETVVVSNAGPREVLLFAQVTANTGVTRVAVGFLI